MSYSYEWHFYDWFAAAAILDEVISKTWSAADVHPMIILWELHGNPSTASWYILLTDQHTRIYIIAPCIKLESHSGFQFSVTLPVGTTLVHRCLISHKEAQFCLTGD